MERLNGPWQNALTRAVKEGLICRTILLSQGSTVPIARCICEVPSGVELGGALKNVLAIACGISDGLGFGHNARAALITRGLSEITRLAVALGAHPLTMGGLAGMGDLVLTCTGGPWPPSAPRHAAYAGAARGRGPGGSARLRVRVHADGRAWPVGGEGGGRGGLRPRGPCRERAGGGCAQGT